MNVIYVVLIQYWLTDTNQANLNRITDHWIFSLANNQIDQLVSNRQHCLTVLLRFTSWTWNWISKLIKWITVTSGLNKSIEINFPIFHQSLLSWKVSNINQLIYSEKGKWTWSVTLKNKDTLGKVFSFSFSFEYYFLFLLLLIIIIIIVLVQFIFCFLFLRSFCLFWIQIFKFSNFVNVWCVYDNEN